MILVALVAFLAGLVQALLGFGGALIAMPLLTPLVGIGIATPAYAAVGAVATLFNTVRLREHVTPRDLARLVAPALLGIPLGVWMLANVDARVVTAILGLILIFYALYNLLGLTMPPLEHSGWAYLAGFSSGVLGGAFNTGGPPMVVYASARHWTADRFRGNLQAYFLLISVFGLAAHGISGHLTQPVGRIALTSIPTLLIGQFVGARLCRYVEPALFRKIVLVVLLLLGGQLLLG